MEFVLKRVVWEFWKLILFINANYNPLITFKRQPTSVPLQSAAEKIEEESSKIWINFLCLVLLLFVLFVITVYLSYKWRHKKTKVENLQRNTSSLQFSPVLHNPSLTEKPSALVGKLQLIKSRISIALVDSNTNSEIGEDDLLNELHLKELSEVFLECLELIEKQNNKASSCENVKMVELGENVLFQDKVEEADNVNEIIESHLQSEIPPKSSTSIDSLKEDLECVSEGLKSKDIINSFKEDHNRVSEGPKAEDISKSFKEDHDRVSEGLKDKDIINSFKDHNSVSEGPKAENRTNSFKEDPDSVSEGLKDNDIINSFKEDHDSAGEESNAEETNLNNHINVQDTGASTSDLIKDTPIQICEHAKGINGKTLIIQIDFNKRLKLAEIK